MQFSKNIAVILAAGSGKRFSNLIPKQFSRIGGKMLIEHAILAFSNCEEVSSIIVICQENKIGFINLLANKLQIKKPFHAVKGGNERLDSTNNAIKFLQNIASDEDNILIHDAARPFLSEDIILKCIKALETEKAVDVVVDIKDTIVEVDENGILKNIPKRSNLKASQTPQAFKFGILKKAFELAYAGSNLQFTDDCGVIMKFLPDVKIATVMGSDTNIKITSKLDIIIADKLLRMKSKKCNKDSKISKSLMS